MEGGALNYFTSEGVITRRLPDYEERPEQLALVSAIERSLSERRHLLAEAGTGIGKSFAYLLPSVLHACANRGDGPVIISTRTIALQQQLDQKDLPFLHSVLPQEWTSATAVGRANYLCLRRMNLAQKTGGLFADPQRESQLRSIVDWSLSTAEGTRMDLPRPVDGEVWDEVRAEQGNCLHRACPHYEPCHYQRSRRRMNGVQILIVNHSLYMADVALRMAGASYLPPHEVVIFDEAHHLERVATENLGLTATESSVRWHLRRLHPRNASRSLLLEHGSPRAGHLWHEASAATGAFFADLEARLAGSGSDTQALEDQELDRDLAGLLGDLGEELMSNAMNVTETDRRMELESKAHRLLGLQAALDQLCSRPISNSVRWLERARKGPALRAAPLDVGEALGAHVFNEERTAILLSATLGNGKDQGFGWLRKRLGIGDDVDTVQLGSPFDYRNCVELVIEEALPDPGADSENFLCEARNRLLEHLINNGGRALVLCTSWASVKLLADYLRPSLRAEGIELLVQGDDTLARLLAEKARDTTSVLIGTDSLWEGIDVPGEALTLVIVVRFPFARPDHPLTRARMREVEREGGNAFADFSLPEAVLKFRQGFGRLVRSGSDHGKVVVLDPRARTRPYGRMFLDALPEGVRTD